MGSLEGEVLECLWSFDAAATPADVIEAMESELAYTTVMTILSRLWQKGLVERQKTGRAYAYRPVISEAELTAQRMQAHLAGTGNRKAALMKFVETRPARDARSLRTMLDKLP